MFIDIIYSVEDPEKFVEIENMIGESIKIGQWLRRDDGEMVLRLEVKNHENMTEEEHYLSKLFAVGTSTIWVFNELVAVRKAVMNHGRDSGESLTAAINGIAGERSDLQIRVKELEQTCNNLEADLNSVASDNQRLKEEIERLKQK